MCKLCDDDAKYGHEPNEWQSASTGWLGSRLMQWWADAPDVVNAWLTTAACVLVITGAAFSHGNWLAAFFSFSATYFAWRVVTVTNTLPNNCLITSGAQKQNQGAE